jgi:hypothetical protein
LDIFRILRQTIFIFLFIYFSFGAFLLPNGDFSILKDIPNMYHHCKLNEDKDMTFIDFITDHLINIDGCLDKHDHGDQQKPHKYNLHSNLQIHLFCAIDKFEISFKNSPYIKKQEDIICESSSFDNYISSILKPPITI